MEEQSFMNPGIASIMNKNFVNIKVDREERPDVDRVYMAFITATTGHGGWPMSVWLTPELTPIFGGTYFPPEDKWGTPGFPFLLAKIAALWSSRRDEILLKGRGIMQLLEQGIDARLQPTEESNEGAVSDAKQDSARDWLELAFTKFEEEFDPQLGGFGGAPKFPRPVILQFLLNLYAHFSRVTASLKAQATDATPSPTSASPRLAGAPVAAAAATTLSASPKLKGSRRLSVAERNCLQTMRMCTTTLDAMHRGGLYDHLGGGFHRYSVDQFWHVPHFEKMLFDQAQLALTYAMGFQLTRIPAYAQVCRDTLAYVLRDLAHPLGGFFSAEDADSLPSVTSESKSEGAYYVWSYEEISTTLSQGDCAAGVASNATDLAVFCYAFGVRPQGNIRRESNPHGELARKNHLFQEYTLQETADHFHLPLADVANRLENARARLHGIRAARPRPHLDDKIIAAWNGLMISALAKAGGVVEEPLFIHAAQKAARFLRGSMYNTESGQLVRSWRDGSASKVGGFLSDYAFVIQGLLDLYEVDGDTTWLEWALQLQSKQDELFHDPNGGGGYFVTSTHDPSILVRLKCEEDSAEPAGNSIAAINLLRLANLVNRPEMRDRAAALITSHQFLFSNAPTALPMMLSALQFLHSPNVQVVLVTKNSPTDVPKPKDEPTRPAAAASAASEAATELQSVVLSQCFIPFKSIVHLQSDASRRFLRNKLPAVDDYQMIDNQPTAYVCQSFACQAPVTSVRELRTLLGATLPVQPFSP
ncbi:spermatogenesis-associated protein 20 [Capsaspora owczarzaki ATCC 30864]|nr:spermatogenesis-associated protein 20 [Capsaspora owczarzaki ATCC 30864]KJE92466.1 spermatogenesis-associated protein 20, variant 1 [Capsaspora owczarzaki ATCC 30864]KJE92467.1 spermatogenesis-associated protein 20, variant 2 [Capsaspora owczarzaki ATCC 30864]KJE92468.1 spermatogenesis-associated protein 20, variant 3 [Capsaspora owczarzaki ATCC 30864]|eukprot:XP_004364276.2 spermatogenesis-associated protein 20 [Capsaspora owczarzaki ATCC 30864]